MDLTSRRAPRGVTDPLTRGDGRRAGGVWQVRRLLIVFQAVPGEAERAIESITQHGEPDPERDDPALQA